MTGTRRAEAWPGVVIKLLSGSTRSHADDRGDGTLNRMWSMPGRGFVALRKLVIALAAVGASMLAVGVVSAVAPAAASAAVWRVQPGASPLAPAGQLGAVSCASSMACTAVGQYTNDSGTQVALAERWNGTSWSMQATPTATGSSFDGVSCTSSAACTAVGGYGGTTLAERWNGTSWSIQATPNLTGDVTSYLVGVSCTSSTACIAVGYDNNYNSATTLMLAERWNGTSWSIEATPNPANASSSSLSGVSCTSSAACTAVGSYSNSSGAGGTLAERWNGTSWSVQATPNPTGAYGTSLVGVSCTSSAACTAVGSYTDSSGAGGTLAERWNGTSWSVQATPNPTGTYGSSLGGVSCASSTACTAVGNYFKSSSGGEMTLAERWNGTSWSIQATPAPTGTPSSWLGGVSCTSSTACAAVGGYLNPSGALTLAERWNGTSWSINATPTPADPSAGGLGGVSCASNTACTAVGSYTNSSGVGATLAERWNGTSWSMQATPNPTGAGLSMLGGASCTPSVACTAVGSYTTGPGTVGTLAEGWNGTSWSIQATPTPMGASSSSLVGVSCTSTTACTAVGNYITDSSSGTGGTLVEGWNGTSWSIAATPNPTGAVVSSLDGVSCTSSAACTAVGSYTDGSGAGGGTLAERWNGTSWSVQATPNPTGAYQSSLSGVSCTSSKACTAVGNYYNSSSGAELTLAETWNGTSWSIQATPNPAGTSSSSLAGVSCTSSTACAAVGNYLNSSGGVTLAEGWNGTSWSIQATPPTPTGNYQSSLGAVSCTSSAACTAVGSYESTLGPAVPLAERYS